MNPIIPGQPIDLTAWAYEYHKESALNPPETDWLWANRILKAEKVNGSLTWNYIELPKPLADKNVLRGYIWEEGRDLKRVTVGFPDPDGATPGPDEIEIYCLPVQSMWEACQAWTWEIKPVAYEFAGKTDDGTYEFKSDVARTTKLYIVYTGSERKISDPVIHAYGESVWAEPIRIEAKCAEEGTIEASIYNGYMDEVEMRDTKCLKMRVFQSSGPRESRTDVTLSCISGKFTFCARDLETGPVYIPGGSLLICAAGGPDIPEFQKQLADSGLKTIRERVGETPEVSVEQALRAYFKKTEFPQHPVPEFETPMKVDVADRFVSAQWKIGAWHLRRWTMDMEDGKYCVSIWPFTKNNGGREGAAAIGAETFQILKTMDMIGMSDIAEGGLKYWLAGDHATPFVWFAENVEKGGWLFNLYNSPNLKSPGYDQKHSGGHGKILEAAAFHYRMVRDGAWLEKWRPVFERACRTILAMRAEWNKNYGSMEWSRGMIPPANGGDGGDTSLYFYLSICWLSGLKSMTEILGDADLSAECEAFRMDLVRAAEMSAALSPVIRVRDGTYRRYIPYEPYLRGPLTDLPFDPNLTSNGLMLVPVAMDANDPIIREMLDVHEDVYHSIMVPEPPAGDDWAAIGGHGFQGGHESQQRIYLAQDDIPMYIRTVFNGYASEVSPDNGYVFYEGPDCAGAIDKTFEEASFLAHIRMMLVAEEDDSLWLAKAAPRAWFAAGERIAVEDAPTFFGQISYKILSEAGRIHAVVTPPMNNAPKMIHLRFRHPEKKPITKVTVNGIFWNDYDREKEIITLRSPFTGPLEVVADYG